ncbi:MAG: hypothetical protein Q8Q81_10865 [Oxalobacteraceae bacterium]|nr:hypothetical protein [Oxalobacteraceae bacterium]
MNGGFLAPAVICTYCGHTRIITGGLQARMDRTKNPSLRLRCTSCHRRNAKISYAVDKRLYYSEEELEFIRECEQAKREHFTVDVDAYEPMLPLGFGGNDDADYVVRPYAAPNETGDSI